MIAMTPSPAQACAIDTPPNMFEARAWWGKFMNESDISIKVSLCDEAYRNLKQARDAAEKTKDALDVYGKKPVFAKPLSEDARVAELLPVVGSPHALDKIREHAERDAEFQELSEAHDNALAELEECMGVARERYDQLVKCLRGQLKSK